MTDFPETSKRVTFTCLDEDDAPTDPDSLVVKYRRLYDAATTKTWPADSEITREDTGVFSIVVPCPSGGTYAARAAAEGDLIASVEITWEIEAGSF
jgi:hypothetical protein